MRSVWLSVIVLAGLAWVASTGPARGEDIPRKYRPAVERGLEWMRKNQGGDGSWAAANGSYAMTMTALGGMVFLMEGSTLREGKYRDQVRKAADFIMARTQPNGLIGNPAVHSEGGRYMYGHGFGLLFLASLVGEEDNEKRRKDLVRILEVAARFTRLAQTKRGGWGYHAATDPAGRPDFDEGSVTITQLQGLRAVRNAGIPVPGEAIKDAVKYLEAATTERGDVIYSLTTKNKAISPALTAAAICCGFSAGEYDTPLVRKWFKYCREAIPTPGGGVGVGDRRSGHDEYTHYYYSQAMYALGEDRWAKMFPDDRGDDKMTWTRWRDRLFDHLLSTQNPDGSWSSVNWTATRVGPVYVTGVYLSVMQLDKAVLPIYQR